MVIGKAPLESRGEWLARFPTRARPRPPDQPRGGRVPNVKIVMTKRLTPRLAKRNELT